MYAPFHISNAPNKPDFGMGKVSLSRCVSDNYARSYESLRREIDNLENLPQRVASRRCHESHFRRITSNAGRNHYRSRLDSIEAVAEHLPMRTFWKTLGAISALAAAVLLQPQSSLAQDAAAEASQNEIRVGIIGLDTSHVIAFTKAMNNPDAEGHLATCRVVAAYPKGSPDIESSVSRVPKYTQQMKEMGIKIVPSIAELLEQVDAVLLETNDGRPHYEQVLPVLKAGKRVFIDKPIAGSLADAIRIFDASEKYGVPLFSSSSLRFGPNSLAVRGGSIGEVTHCQTTSPASIEKTHPDLFWYGIHGVESLFTVMGTGCESVVRSKTEEGKIQVDGKWKGGRTGVFLEGKGYSGTAKGEKGESEVGSYPGYTPLVAEIAKYFQTGEMPVMPEETLEIYAFMEAADESKRQGGAEVTLASVMEKARAEVKTKP
ncbi:MAG: Gfo/Idh/MocA family oxidoreductase [Verrucomicrobiota bacterium]